MDPSARQLVIAMAENERPSRPKMLRFSLSTLLVLVTVFCAWLGLGMERARSQKRAVAGLTSKGFFLMYDFQHEGFTSFGSPLPKAPKDGMFLTRLLGVDFFHRIESANVSDSSMAIGGPPPAVLPPLESEDVELLGSLSDLKSLLAHRDIDAGDLVSIAEFDRLERLIIGSYSGDEETLTRVRQQHRQLEITILID
jgi:hypothetical protein